MESTKVWGATCTVGCWIWALPNHGCSSVRTQTVESQQEDTPPMWEIGRQGRVSGRGHSQGRLVSLHIASDVLKSCFLLLKNYKFCYTRKKKVKTSHKINQTQSLYYYMNFHAVRMGFGNRNCEVSHCFTLLLPNIFYVPIHHQNNNNQKMRELELEKQLASNLLL